MSQYMPYPLPSAPPLPNLYDIQPKLANEAAKKVADKPVQQVADKALQKYIDEHKKPNLKEECGFCLSLLSEQPEGDFNEGVVLTMTKCAHWFHEFCLNGLLDHVKAPNKDCPICHALINRADLTLYPVPANLLAKKPEQNSSAPNSTVEPKIPVAKPVHTAPGVKLIPVAQETPKQPANQSQPAEGPGVLKSIWSWAAYKYATWESPEVTKARIALTEKRLKKLDAKCQEMPEDFKAQKKSMAQLIATVRVFMDNPSKDRAEAIKYSVEAEKQVETLKKHYVTFTNQLDSHEKAFKESIEKEKNIFLDNLKNFDAELNKAGK
jgi:hypothetical protein